MAAYRRSSTYAGLWLLLVFAGIGIAIALAATLHPYQNQIGGWIMAIMTVPILGAIIVAAVIQGRLTKGRHLALGEALQSDGFYFELEPTPESLAEFWGPLQHLVEWAGLQTGSAGIKWIAHAEGRRVCLFEHEYTTGSGKSTQVHPHTLVCFYGGLEEPVGARLANVGSLAATRPGFGETRAILRGAQDLQTGDAELDKNWVILGDPAMATLFFTDEVRRRLADSPKGERWLLGANWSVCVCRGHLDAENLRLFLQRARGVLDSTTALPWEDEKPKE